MKKSGRSSHTKLCSCWPTSSSRTPPPDHQQLREQISPHCSPAPSAMQAPDPDSQHADDGRRELERLLPPRRRSAASEGAGDARLPGGRERRAAEAGRGRGGGGHLGRAGGHVAGGVGHARGGPRGGHGAVLHTAASGGTRAAAIAARFVQASREARGGRASAAGPYDRQQGVDRALWARRRAGPGQGARGRAHGARHRRHPAAHVQELGGDVLTACVRGRPGRRALLVPPVGRGRPARLRRRHRQLRHVRRARQPPAHGGQEGGRVALPAGVQRGQARASVGQPRHRRARQQQGGSAKGAEFGHAGARGAVHRLAGPGEARAGAADLARRHAGPHRSVPAAAAAAAGQLARGAAVRRRVLLLRGGHDQDAAAARRALPGNRCGAEPQAAGELLFQWHGVPSRSPHTHHPGRGATRPPPHHRTIVETDTRAGLAAAGRVLQVRSAFQELQVDGDLLLLLSEQDLSGDFAMKESVTRRRFLRELAELKTYADYSACDGSKLCEWLNRVGPGFRRYTYGLLRAGVTRPFLAQLTDAQLTDDCCVDNGVHRATILTAAARAAADVGSPVSSGGESPTSGDKPDVFISYRRATGSQMASLLKVHLQLHGFSAFLDVEKLTSGKFEEKLLASVRAAQSFLLVLTPNALDKCMQDVDHKDWVHKEIVTALQSKKNIVPVYDKFEWPDPSSLPEDMRGILKFNGIKWSHEYQDATIEKIVRFLKRLSEGPLHDMEANGGGGGIADSGSCCCREGQAAAANHHHVEPTSPKSPTQ